MLHDAHLDTTQGDPAVKSSTSKSCRMSRHFRIWAFSLLLFPSPSAHRGTTRARARENSDRRRVVQAGASAILQQKCSGIYYCTAYTERILLRFRESRRKRNNDNSIDNSQSSPLKKCGRSKEPTTTQPLKGVCDTLPSRLYGWQRPQRVR